MLLLKQIPQDKSCSKDIFIDYLRMSIEVAKIGSFGINNLKVLVASNKTKISQHFPEEHHLPKLRVGGVS